MAFYDKKALSLCSLKAVYLLFIHCSILFPCISFNCNNCTYKTKKKKIKPQTATFKKQCTTPDLHYCVEAQKNWFWSQTYQAIGWMLLPLSQRQIIAEFLWRNRKKNIPTFIFREVKTQLIYGLSENIQVYRNMHCTLPDLVSDTRCKGICVSMQFAQEECFNRKKEPANPSICFISEWSPIAQWFLRSSTAFSQKKTLIIFYQNTLARLKYLIPRMDSIINKLLKRSHTREIQQKKNTFFPTSEKQLFRSSLYIKVIPFKKSHIILQNMRNKLLSGERTLFWSAVPLKSENSFNFY